MSIQLEGSALSDLNQALRREWLETNGLGGCAGSTLSGAHGRRDHGLLVAGAEGGRPPMVLLSRLDETLYLPHAEEAEGADAAAGTRGAEVFELATNVFPGPNVYPQGYRYLTSFKRDLFPVFDYEAGGIELRKTIAAVDGETATLVTYEVLAAPRPFLFELRPFVAGRDARSLSRANATLSREATFERSVLHLAPYAGLPEIFVKAPGATFHYQPDWWFHFVLAADDAREDLFTPGVLRFELAAGDSLGLLIATADPAGRDPLALFTQERQRRVKLLAKLPVADELTRVLALAGEQFSLRRKATERTLAAGFPGGEESTAETLVALPGLLLATGRLDDAKKVLRTVARAVGKDGELPDRLSAAAEGVAGATALDGGLWMFPAAWRYLAASGDEDFVRETLLPALRRIAAAYERGTAAGVRVGEDGELTVAHGERAGAPVELNALWAAALATWAELEAGLGEAQAAKALAERARRTARRFTERFWNADTEALFDRLEGGASERRHAEIRPHQILALALPHPLLPKAKAGRLLETLESELATPFGLRDRPVSEGGEEGPSPTWTWLLGPYLTALVRVRGAAGRKQALAHLAQLEPHLLDGAVGTIAEIVGAEAPHAGQGHVASAISVAELLRAYVDDLHPVKPAPAPRAAKAKPATRPATKPARRPRPAGEAEA